MGLHSIENIKNMIVDVADFPKKGVVFKDITPILDDPKAFHSLFEHFKNTIDFKVDKVVAIESRGFLLGGPLAMLLEAGLVLVRKPGKLPRETVKQSYDLEYGQDSLEIQKDDLKAGDRVLIVDDVLATGGTAHAAENLCGQLGAEVVGHRFLIELGFLAGAEKLKAPSRSLINYL